MDIYNKHISAEKVNLIISTVQDKRELSDFSEISIKKFAKFIFKRDAKILSLFVEKTTVEIAKSKLFKQLIKDIRAIARRIYGVYITKNYSKKEILLNSYDFSKEQLDMLLDLHMSTRERLPYYESIYAELIKLTCNPKSVLDLACGFNPFSSLFLDKTINYFASDISEKDVIFLNSFFDVAKKSNMIGKKSTSFRQDLSDKSTLNNLNKYDCDWCLIFKGLDPIEEISQNITYDLLDEITSKWIIVSFPTVTVSRKPMTNPRRNWFEKVLDRKELSYDTYEVPNELFYIIKNKT